MANLGFRSAPARCRYATYHFTIRRSVSFHVIVVAMVPILTGYSKRAG
jgi:hypothetical protein